ncbi:MAG: hypothetical protein ACK5ME_03855 [Parahaliea sp.]
MLKGVIKLLLWLSGLVLLLLVISLLAWQLGLNPNAPSQALASFNERIAPWRHYMQLVRCGLWVVIWHRWQWIGERWFYRRGNEEAATAWLGSRPMVIATLALVELLILLRQAL